MFKEKLIFFMLAETSIHAGSGEDVGHIDLPIQRNKITNHPIIQPSQIKGAIRDFFEISDLKDYKDEDIFAVFGPNPEGGAEYSSAISFSEAKVLFFPIKSLYGVFAYVTCPYILNKFFKDADLNININLNIPDSEIIIPNDSIVKVDSQVILHDFPFNIKPFSDLPKINNKNFFEYFRDIIYPKNNNVYNYWRDNFTKRVCIVSDNTFTFLTEIGTEIVTRNRIVNETGVVDKRGGLWDEENIPQETILYSEIYIYNPFNRTNKIKTFEDIKNFIKKIDSKRIQMGGHKTIGKGFVFINFFEGGQNVNK